MSALLELRERCRNIYSKYEIYLTPLFKFLLALITLVMINATVGYMDKLIGNTVLVLVVALMCSFLPTNFIALFAALFISGHMYAISLECGAVAIGIFLLMFILYFRFSPKDALVVVLLPIFFVLKIPYVIPIAVGLLCTPVSIVSVACGTITYYMVEFAKNNAQTIDSLGADGAVAKFRYMLDGVLKNKEMYLVIIAFCVVVITVYLIRRLSIDRAWTIAMSVGAVFNVVLLLFGNLSLDTHISMLGLIFGTIFSLLCCFVLQFFAFNVDYSRTEYVQFEDDEYYYYVKAVPKNSVNETEHKVQKITSVL